MSKFFLTNDPVLFQRAKKCIKESLYQIAFVYENSIFAISTKKLAVDNQNGVKCEDGFTIVTGTLAWSEGKAIDNNTLIDIFHHFDGDINKTRENCIGNFAISILKNNTLHVFGETTGFYNIYYYNTNDKWLISNSLYDLAIILKGELELNELALIESTVQDGILLNDTFYKQIHRLSGFDYIRISNQNFEIIEENQFYPMCQGTLSEIVEHYKELAISYGKKMASAYGSPTISMTGGLDARMVLSSYLAAGIKPCLYYGTGNSFITNTFHEDKEIDMQFASKFDLCFFDESWATPNPIDKYWSKYLKLYGFYFMPYAGSDAVFESIFNNTSKLFTYGYCGELLRNLPWIESRTSSYFTLKEYMDDFYLPDAIKAQIVNEDVYEQYIWDKLVRICKHYNLDVNCIPNEDIFYLSLERRKSADSAMVNLVNFMKYCSYSLGQYENLKAGRVKCIEASNSSFMLRCLDALYPSVLDVPVFTHCTIREFDRETMSLKLHQESAFDVLKKKIKKSFPWLVRYLRKYMCKFNGDEEKYQYIRSLYDNYNQHELIYRDKITNERRLVKYIMNLYAINKLDS